MRLENQVASGLKIGNRKSKLKENLVTSKFGPKFYFLCHEFLEQSTYLSLGIVVNNFNLIVHRRKILELQIRIQIEIKINSHFQNNRNTCSCRSTPASGPKRSLLLAAPSSSSGPPSAQPVQPWSVCAASSD